MMDPTGPGAWRDLCLLTPSGGLISYHSTSNNDGLFRTVYDQRDKKKVRPYSADSEEE